MRNLLFLIRGMSSPSFTTNALVCLKILTFRVYIKDHPNQPPVRKIGTYNSKNNILCKIPELLEAGNI